MQVCCIQYPDGCQRPRLGQPKGDSPPTLPAKPVEIMDLPSQSWYSQLRLLLEPSGAPPLAGDGLPQSSGKPPVNQTPVNDLPLCNHIRENDAFEPICHLHSYHSLWKRVLYQIEWTHPLLAVTLVQSTSASSEPSGDPPLLVTVFLKVQESIL